MDSTQAIAIYKKTPADEKLLDARAGAPTTTSPPTPP
jgi:hypothetical protein